MRNFRELLAAFATVLLAAPGVGALEILVRDAAGNATIVVDNDQRDLNTARGTIDFNVCVMAVGDDGGQQCTFAATGRLEEVTTETSRLLRLTRTPGPPEVGNVRNTSQQPGVFVVIVDSSRFAPVAAGATWRLSYVGRGFDGPGAPLPGPCHGNGAVTIPVHQVTGQLDRGEATLGSVLGPAFIQAKPASFSRPETGSTPLPATSLRASWLLDPGACDGIRLASGIELELISPHPDGPENDSDGGQPGDQGAEMTWVILIVLFLLLVLYAVAEHRGQRSS